MKKKLMYMLAAGMMFVASGSVYAATTSVPGPGDKEKKEKKKKNKKAKKGKSCSYEGAKKSCCSHSKPAESSADKTQRTPAN